MPTYRVKGPDGRVYVLRGPGTPSPDGRRPHQIAGTPEYERAKNENALRARFQEPGRPEAEPLPADETRNLRASYGVLNTLASLATPSQEGRVIAGDIRQARQDIKPEGFDLAGLGGEALATAPLGGLKVLQGGGKLATVANRALAGAAQGVALSANTESGLGVDAGIGAATGVAAPPLLQAAGKAVSGALRPAAQALKDQGVKLTLGQTLGPTATRIEQGLTSVPILGDMIRKRQTESFESFNTAVANDVLKPLGKTVPKGVEAGRDLVNHVHDQITQRYDQLLPQAMARADQQLAQDLAPVRSAVATLPKKQQVVFEAIVKQQLENQLDRSGALAGQNLKNALSELGRRGGGLRSGADAHDRELGDALLAFQKALKGSAVRNSPANVGKELAATDAAYARYLRLQDAAGRVTSPDGLFSPEALGGSVKKFDKSRHKGKFARGEALMQDLADSGRDVLGRKVPDSGTPLRMATNVGLGMGIGGGAMLEPITLALTAATAAPFTKAGTNSLRYLLTERPELARTLGDYISRSAHVAGPIAAPQTVAIANALIQGRDH